jgi:hypothetical protein
LPLYQRALQIDATIDDHHSAATDWYSYAGFLREAGFPVRFAYASILKSQSLLGSDATEKELTATNRVRKELEHELGPQAAVIRGNPEPTWRDAITLKTPVAQLKSVSSNKGAK